MKILITSGGTKINIDSVRAITNMSKGTFGAKIATVALKDGHDVSFVHAKNSSTPFTSNINVLYDTFTNQLQDVIEKRLLYENIINKRKPTQFYTEFEYDTFETYGTQLKRAMGLQPDIVILAAAVSDYGTTPISGKARSRFGELNISLTPLPKLISKIKEWHPSTFLVGFKLLVNSTLLELQDAARASIESNKCDLVVANDLRDIKAGNHKLLIMHSNHSIVEYASDQFSLERNRDTNYLASKVIEQSLLGYKDRK